MIRTILGDINSGDLGFTAMHEHILMFSDERLVIDELAAFKEAGGAALVEVTTLGLVDLNQRGGNAEQLAQISKLTGLHIIAGTGYYKEPKLPSFVPEWDANRLAAHMITEIQSGVGGTQYRAGIIGEVGSSNYKIYPTEEKVLHAAAMAQSATGAAITTHTGRGSMVHEQLDIFESEGADLRRVVIGHLDVQPHLRPLFNYYQEIASRGANLQFDTVGKEGFFELHLDPAYGQKFPYDRERAEVVLELCEQGYADQILISCDVDTPELTRRHGGGGYARLLSFAEDLRAGLPKETIAKIFVDNPRRILDFQGKNLS